LSTLTTPSKLLLSIDALTYVKKADDSPILSSLFFGPDEKCATKLQLIREKTIELKWVFA